MDSVAIERHDLTSLDAIASGVHGLRIVFVNVFAIRTEQGWTLVDTGLYGSAHYIRSWVEQHFGDSAPTSIVLTHGHFDHVGALETLAKEWRVPVFAHEDELAYVRGEREYPAPDPSVGGGLMARLSGLYPRRPVTFDGDLRALAADGSVPLVPGWRWIHTPGHSAGHISLFRDSDRTLIVGDAFCTTKQESFLAVASQRPELHGPPAYFTTDWIAARASVQTLAALQPVAIAPGHGQPLRGGDTAANLEQLAARFDEIALPDRGRYIGHPVRE